MAYLQEVLRDHEKEGLGDSPEAREIKRQLYWNKR
jgi:hypothetical protein